MGIDTFVATIGTLVVVRTVRQCGLRLYTVFCTSWKHRSFLQVARWRDDYGIDGIDLDLEEGAGGKKVLYRVTEINFTNLCAQAAGPNMVHFIRKIKSIHPDLIVSQPTYGYPQVCSLPHLLTN